MCLFQHGSHEFHQFPIAQFPLSDKILAVFETHPEVCFGVPHLQVVVGRQCGHDDTCLGWHAEIFAFKPQAGHL